MYFSSLGGRVLNDASTLPLSEMFSATSSWVGSSHTSLLLFCAAVTSRLAKNEALKKSIFYKLEAEDFIDQLPSVCERLGEIFHTSTFSRLADIEFPTLFIQQDFPNTYSSSGNLDLAELCTLYETGLSADVVFQEGSVYTPSPVADAMYRTIAKGNRESCLDPACGSGVFLLTIMRGREKSRRQEALWSGLYGIDRDIQAVEFTKIILLLCLIEESGLHFSSLPDLTDQIVHGDFLLDPSLPDWSSNTLPNAIVLAEAFPKVIADGGFDLIIGNPPYGLSRDEKLSVEENEQLKKLYKESVPGKPNKYLFFLARSYSLLNKTGTLSFLVPNAWLGIESGITLRHLFMKERSLTSIARFECEVFPGTGVEPIVVTLNRMAKTSEISISSVESIAPWIEAKTDTISYETWGNMPDGIFPVRWNRSAEVFFKHLNSSTKRLGDHSSLQPRIALQAYAAGKGTPPQTKDTVKNHPFHFSEKIDEQCIRYLEGKDISRYSTSWSGSYLQHGPWLAEPQTIERFQGPRILVREITGSLPHLAIATVIEEECLYNKSVLHIIGLENASTDEMYALVAAMNSKFGSCVFGYRGRKIQRTLFPKLVNQDLKDFPIPRAGFSTLLSKLSRQRHSTSVTDCVSQLEERIDLEVCDTYGISMDIVEACLQGLTNRKVH